MSENFLYFDAVKFSPDGQTLAVGTSNPFIFRFDVKALLDDDTSDGEAELPRLEGQKDGVLALAFSPDGQLLAVSTIDQNVIIWDLDTEEPVGEPLMAYSERERDIDLVFSPDGQTIAYGGAKTIGEANDLIFLGDIASGKQYDTPLVTGVVPLGTSTKFEAKLAYSPDGRTLASSSLDRKIRLWDVDVNSWLSRACQRANRNLTLEEWHNFFGEEPYRPTCPNL
jgi:WD40 repeat protein